MKPAGNPWMKFYPADWRSDAMLRLCSIAARGLWAEMMCLMHAAEKYGSLLVNGKRIDKKQLAGLAGISEKDCSILLLELETNGVFSRDEDGTIYSRRMRRDHAKAIKDKENGKKGGAPDLIGSVPKDERERRFSRKDNPTKIEAVWASSGGKCQECQCVMQRDYPNEPDAFTVDHIIALAEGGDNSMENLQALCRACNRRKGLTPAAAVGDKAQKPEARSQSPEKKETREVALVSDFEFEDFWNLWPNKVGKPAALKAFVSARKRAGLDAIVDGVFAYIRDKPPDRAWLNPATFLNQNRWEDQPAQVANGRNEKTQSLSDIARRHAAEGISFGERPASPSARLNSGLADVRLLPQGGSERSGDICGGNGIGPERIPAGSDRLHHGPEDGSAEQITVVAERVRG